MTMTPVRICLFCLEKPVQSSRPDAKFCSNAHKQAYYRAQKAVTLPDPGPSTQDEPVTPSSPPGGPAIGPPDDRIPPPRPSHRRLGDFDIRDKWARSEGTEFAEELPVFLRRKVK